VSARSGGGESHGEPQDHPATPRHCARDIDLQPLRPLTSRQKLHHRCDRGRCCCWCAGLPRAAPAPADPTAAARGSWCYVEVLKGRVQLPKPRWRCQIAAV